MRLGLLLTLVASLSVGVVAQGFECQPLGPFPNNCCGDCEQVQANNGTTGGKATVDNIPSCGFPSGLLGQYARAEANGPIAASHPAGTPISRPIALNVTEIRVPVPPGAPGVSIHFNFYNAELAFGPPSATFNDGMEIAVMAFDDTTVLQTVAYVDTFSPIAAVPCVDPVSTGVDTGANGADFVSVTFGGVLPTDAYLSIAVWNSGDNGFNSHGVVDCISWGVWEFGNLSGPRVVNTTVPASNAFKIGAQTCVQMQAGLPFLEGSHCMVAQTYDDNLHFPTQVPGIAGDLYICTDRPILGALTEGLLTGGANPGRGANFCFTISDPSLCGTGILIQSYVITEQLTNPTWTTALVGFIHE